MTRRDFLGVAAIPLAQVLDGGGIRRSQGAVIGADGFGFADTRPAARRFFHVDAESITLAVLSQLVRQGEVKPEVLGQAISKYRLDVAVSELG